MLSKEAGDVTFGYHLQLLLFKLFHDFNTIKNLMWQNTATVLSVVYREGAMCLLTQIIWHRVQQLRVC